MIYPWLQQSWKQLAALGERLPHALLFAGPGGLGKRELAETFAAHLLCRQPDVEGLPCDECDACVLRKGGNHPDLIRVEPAESRPSDSAGETSRRPASGQIVVEQIRALQQALTVTGHQSSRRVAIIDPADAMNTVTANALLKLLEEPPAGCVLLLVSSHPRRLLPTLRSRCQQWQFAPPDSEQARAWLAERAPDAVALLALCGGRPLAAERLAQAHAGPDLARFERDMCAAAPTDPLALAGDWDKWLKSREAAASGMDLRRLVDWVLRWVSDVSMCALGGRVQFFPHRESELRELVRGLEPSAASACYNQMLRIHRVVQHPLNTRLLLEDMLLRYARTINGARL